MAHIQASKTKISLADLSEQVEHHEYYDINSINTILNNSKPDNINEIRFNVKSSTKDRLIFSLGYGKSRKIMTITPAFKKFNIYISGENNQPLYEHFYSIFE